MDSALDHNVLSLAKEEMDAKRGMELHWKNGEEEQKGKEYLQQIFSAIQEKKQNQSSTNYYEGKWSHNHHNLHMGCSLLPLYNQLSITKEEETSQKEKDTPNSEEVSCSTPQPNLSMDKCNGTQSLEASNNNQHLLEIKPEEDYQRCIWCISYSLQREKKEETDHIPKRERPIPSSSKPGWKCDSNSNKILGVRELCGDECLDFFIPLENRSPYQVSNNVINNRGNSGTMQKLPSLSDLVNAVKNDPDEFHEFHEPTDKWIVDQVYKQYFSDTFGISNIHPLFVGCQGMVVLFLDDRGILFAWCEMTREMFVLGINKMEGLANFLYNPKKRCIIIEETGELILEEEFIRSVMEDSDSESPEEE